MRISALFYNIRQGLKNIVRNKMFSLASVATMAACIFLFGLLFAVVVNFQYMVLSAEQGVAVTVFFDDYVLDDEMQEIGSLIEARSEVSEMKFVSANEAWDEFKDVYFEGQEHLVDAFDEDNPLQESSHFEVYLNDVADQDALVTYIKSIEGVRKVNSSQAVADGLANFNVLVGYISAAIVLILLAVSIFLISNTITIGISVRDEEIAIMKLIGAKDSFVRAPFIVEGIVLGMIGSAIPLAGLYYIYQQVMEYIQGRFNVLTDILVFVPAADVFRILLPAGFGLGIGIGLIGSLITIRRHLRV